MSQTGRTERSVDLWVVTPVGLHDARNEHASGAEKATVDALLDATARGTRAAAPLAGLRVRNVVMRDHDPSLAEPGSAIFPAMLLHPYDMLDALEQVAGMIQLERDADPRYAAVVALEMTVGGSNISASRFAALLGERLAWFDEHQVPLFVWAGGMRRMRVDLEQHPVSFPAACKCLDRRIERLRDGLDDMLVVVGADERSNTGASAVDVMLPFAGWSGGAPPLPIDAQSRGARHAHPMHHEVTDPYRDVVQTASYFAAYLCTACDASVPVSAAKRDFVDALRRRGPVQFAHSLSIEAQAAAAADTSVAAPQVPPDRPSQLPVNSLKKAPHGASSDMDTSPSFIPDGPIDADGRCCEVNRQEREAMDASN